MIKCKLVDKKGFIKYMVTDTVLSYIEIPEPNHNGIDFMTSEAFHIADAKPAFNRLIFRWYKLDGNYNVYLEE